MGTIFPSVLLSVSCATTLASQTVAGRVIDATDSLTVSGAQIRISGANAIRSDAHGEYRVTRLAAGRHEISVRMLGYAASTDSIELDAGENLTLDLYLVRIPRLLSEMVVKGRRTRVPAGFEHVYRQIDASAGVFVTRETIDSLNARDVASLLNQVQFVRVSPNRDDPNRISSSRCRSGIIGANVSGHPVTLYLNGIPIGNTMAINDILDYTAPSMIQVIEVYNGSSTVPPAYQPSCGVVAIWTRKQ